MLILDPEFGEGIESYFIKAMEAGLTFNLPIIENTESEIIAKIYNFCNQWIKKYDNERRKKILKYLSQIGHPMAN